MTKFKPKWSNKMAKRRLSLLKKQIASEFPEVAHDDSLDKARARSSDMINKEALQSQYFGEVKEAIKIYREKFCSMDTSNHFMEVGIDKEEIRGLNIERLSRNYDYACLNYQADQKEPMNILGFIYVLQEYDQSQSTILVVHICLYLDTIQALGTEKHMHWIHKGFSLEEFGCCCMTEIGHGSNLASLETTAIYDHETKEFVINSPTATSAKWWIGALARNAKSAVVFARLIVDGNDKGVHVFVMRVRDDDHKVLPGLVIGDCGYKISLDGIDNGFILFKNFRVPYDSLLDKHAQITPQGKYKSSFKNNEKRFGIQISGLIRGRTCVSFAGEINMCSGLTIGIRFAAIRKQFGEKNAPERSILDYQLQQARLLPHLAKLFALRAGHTSYARRFKEMRKILKTNPEDLLVGEYHAILSAYKGISSRYSLSALQDVRESLGGHGYSKYASVGRLRDDCDIHITWEGENNVLMQQTAKFILKQVQNKFKGKSVSLESLLFLESDLAVVKKLEFSFSSVEELLETGLLLRILEARCNYLIGTSIEKLQENAMRYESLTEAWNNTQLYYLIDLSKSFGELLLAKELLKMVRQSVSENRQAMFNIFYMYCVKLIHENIALLTEFCLIPSQSNVVKDAVVKLMADLKNVAVPIVDAIGPPDALHGSVLGRSDGQVYKAIIEAVEREDSCYLDAEWTKNIQELRIEGKKQREKLLN